MMLTVKQVAERLCVSATCVYQLIAERKLPCHRIGIGRGAIRVAIEDLTAFVASCRQDLRSENPTGSPPRNRSKRFKHLGLDG